MSKFGQPLLRPLAKASMCLFLLSSLTGCVGLIVGGAVASAVTANDRRTFGAQADDKSIAVKADMRLPKITGPDVHINTTSYNRQVLLTGEVPDDAARQQAEQIISRVENVRTIVNELAPMPVTSLSQRSSDVLVTGKVKASLVDAKDLYVAAFKVVTERGTVYLMGRVTQREADRATAIARQVNGVARVVRIFEIITDDEMRRIQAQSPMTR